MSIKQEVAQHFQVKTI